jgi:hypothetical protein
LIIRTLLPQNLHKAKGMKFIDLRPPPACTDSYRRKCSLFTKKFIICTKKAFHHQNASSKSFTPVKVNFPMV